MIGKELWKGNRMMTENGLVRAVGILINMLHKTESKLSWRMGVGKEKKDNTFN